MNVFRLVFPSETKKGGVLELIGSALFDGSGVGQAVKGVTSGKLNIPAVLIYWVKTNTCMLQK